LALHHTHFSSRWFNTIAVSSLLPTAVKLAFEISFNRYLIHLKKVWFANGKEMGTRKVHPHLLFRRHRRSVGLRDNLAQPGSAPQKDLFIFLCYILMLLLL